MKGTNLGEFEELILLVIGVLDTNAYGAAIISQLEEQTDRKPSVGAVHSSLNRLVEKGYLKSRTGESTASRRGRRKIYYDLTAAGQNALIKTREMRNYLFSLIPNISAE
ncbi:PadR family transcriptional regulator [Fulvivirga lutea]|uniref:PadR family transcriptional regulator n=1 Tax=Fulvivirga lutea TaxID=2810512 RepID=A0A974WM89_9BACT|nr:helix-turn-helix transcriptional regulator [Fulvivirga lutea]QSE98013.1 PadR family transcriptional regulator [Fulvivirga lutea]